MFEWILLVVATLAGGVVLARPAWVGYARGFSGSTLLGFVLLSVGMTSPLLFRLHQMMLDSGAGPDAFIGVWNLWWTKQALLHGMNPFFTSWLYYPSGTSLALHTHAVTYGVATLPLQIVFGSEGGTKLYGIYNLILLASFSLTGYFTYRLALHESQHRGASILAGLIMAFCAFRFANTVRLHVIATELLVLTTWAAVVWVHRPNAMRLLGLLGAGFLLAHASLEYTVIALLVFGWITLSRIFPSRLRPAPLPSPGSSEGRRAILRAAYHEDKPPSPRARRFAWVGIAVLALAAWPLGSAVVRRVAAGGTGFDPRLGLYFSADLLDLFLPNPRHPLWGATFSQ
ncbi:MAG: hypothetical protein KC729_00715, partial [Candidatus Eisenbacteria bacterium]|nr:hypothetical protein [Candidatus Eisenbacteria bacterium]